MYVSTWHNTIKSRQKESFNSAGQYYTYIITLHILHTQLTNFASTLYAAPPAYHIALCDMESRSTHYLFLKILRNILRSHS